MNFFYTKKSYSLFFIIFFICVCTVDAAATKPIAVYLTWVGDPTSSMTIQWITETSKPDDEILFQKEGEETWQSTKGTHSPLPEKEPFFIHRVHLNALSSGSSYRFRIGQDKEGIVYKFRTLNPNPSRPIRFIVGGDFYGGSAQTLSLTHRQAAKQNPDFALVGGDIAYAYVGSKSSQIKSTRNRRWIEWLKLWSDYMVTPSGYLIPLIPAIGNHDTQGRYEQGPEKAIFFYTLFPFPGNDGCNVLDVGSFLSVIVLDSGHTHTVPSQTRWLSQALAQREKQTHKFALYHIPAYPSVRKYQGEKHALIRKYWVPLFEQHGLTAAFEHHDHAYKRTPLILKDKPDQAGVLYLGDGGYGIAKPRTPRKGQSVWYLEKTAAKTHFILVTLEGSKRTYQAIDPMGYTFDRFQQMGKKEENSEMNQDAEANKNLFLNPFTNF